MQNIGIIAEFNPFHLGHEYIIDCAKKQNCGVICVMSGNFVQRGDTALIPKHMRAQMAVECGADLVIELPTVYAMSTAQNFAFGGVDLLNKIGVCDKIIFGSECGDLDALKKASELLLSSAFEDKIAEKLKGGKTFAKIREEILSEISPELSCLLENPNDTLAIEYLAQLKLQDSNIEPICIKRLGTGHLKKADGITASAGEIREKIKAGDYDFAEKYMPKKAFNILKESPISDFTKLDYPILCKLREKRLQGEINNLTDISEGLENRFIKAIEKSGSIEELYANIKTKRYTLARIRRLVLSTFLDIDNSFFAKGVPYIRILGMNEKGGKILSEIAQNSALPIVVTAADANRLGGYAKTVFEKEKLCTDIYSLTLSVPAGCGEEYYKKVYKGEF